MPSTIVMDPIRRELRNFLSIASTRTNEASELELIRSATYLLKNFPPSRDAVLDIFARIVNNSVSTYFSSNSAPHNPAKKSRTENSEAVQMIHDVLSMSIKQNPKGWAPIVSAWALKLLGQLSSEHAGHVNNREESNRERSSDLNDIVQLWLSCQASRILAELTIQCLNELSAAETDTCINALLENSMDHGPDFDWVVAHIGGCVAHTMATRVLSCGLQDFAKYGLEHKTASSKLHSVVGILSHLAASHSINTHQAVTDLFKWSLRENNEQAVAVVPYLLNLSALSRELVDVITGEIVSCIDDAALDSLARKGPIWCTRFFNNSEELVTLVIHHLLRSSQNGFEVVNLLLRTGSDQFSAVPQINEISCKIMELLLAELAQAVQSSGSSTLTDIPFLRSLEPRVELLCHLFIDSDSWQSAVLVRVVTLMSIHCGPNISRQVLTFLLQRIEENPIIPRLIEAVQEINSTIVVDAVHDALESNRAYLENILRNILFFVNVESEQPQLVTVAKHCTFHTAVRINLHLFTRLVALDGQIPSLACRVLENVLLPANLNIKLLSSFGHAAVTHFFSVLEREFSQETERLADIRAVQSVLVALSRQPSGQALVLRLLLKGSFSKEWKQLFGAKVTNPTKSSSSLKTSLLEQNMNFTSSVTVPQRHSSVFHAGIIGEGIRKNDSLSSGLSNDRLRVRANANTLMETLLKCCHSIGQGMAQLSLLLVEVVSPDVMFNGLPWPDEDFTKVTVERDLQIRRFVSEHEYIWDFFELLAVNRPSFCYCSVLIRGLLAVLISHWANCQEKAAHHNSSQLEMTCRLLSLMALGQLLPPPLSYLPELLPHITPHEVYVLLRDVWAFMRDNVPSPALFGEHMWRDFSNFTMDPRYTERLRLILLANIETLGELYPRFFP